MEDYLKLARQCLMFRGLTCDNEGCTNLSCPLNSEYKKYDKKTR